MEFTLAGLWHSMGFLAKLVAVFLGLLSVYSLAVMVERYVVYRRARGESSAFAVEIEAPLQKLQLDQAIRASNPEERPYCPLAHIIHAGLREFQVSEETGEPIAIEVEGVHQAIDRAITIAIANLRVRLGGLATIGATAPFVGLFGTVVGIINAFRGIAATGSGGIASVSAGIAEALVTTAFGLFVAIPAVWAYNYFTSTIDKFSVELDNSAAQLIGHFLKREAKAKGAA
ncbi:MAG: MotA/TolQ/ExbB proton channel family protein [Candidatus Latescibacteria bacterium]|nr:MotA/TolQ/ExbB proton channel family protein [Candidatus Latescibacterota bacterium]